MKIITSLSKILFAATILYSSSNKAVAQFAFNTPPTSCVASPESVTLNQPNGTSITVIGKGNMNNHWTETTDGYSLALNSNGVYEYALEQNGSLVPNGILAHDSGSRTQAELNFLTSATKSLRPTPNPLKTSILNQVRAQTQNKTYPTTGNIRILALLIDYPDMLQVIPKADFDSMMYGANYRGGDGSFKTFYETSSGNQLNVTVDVEGWFTAANNRIYYAADSGYDRAAGLVKEAVDAAELSGVDFSLYDNDGDFDVDGILAVHAGPGAEIGGISGQYIWSHRWNFSSAGIGSSFYDGVTISDYMINPETRSASNNNIAGIGVVCHEFGHNLGLPDLYDTDRNNGNSEGIGEWCLMAGGSYTGNSNRPANFSAWCKEELGWDTPQQLTLGQTGIHTLTPSSTSRDEIFRVNTPLSNEYFLIENRQLLGKDSDIPGHGLAIWHINTTKTNAFGNSVNADETLKGVDLEEADGNDDLDNEVNRGDGGDLFPGTSNATSFTDNTTPSAQNYLLGNTGFEIRNIVETVGGSITFDFGQVPGPPCAASTTFTTNTGSFDDGSGAGLDYVNNQTCSWLITPTAGTVTLSFSAFDIEPINDTVTVYDGMNNSAPLLGRFSGNAIPASVTSSANAMFVQFKSNATINGPGFDASFITNVPATPCSGLTTLTTATGSFSDGSGTANYTNNQNCSWLIQPPGAASITFGLSSLATEIGNDRITVYDGTTAAAPILGSFSGTNNLNTFTSSTGSIFVTFVTNGTVTDQGFDAFYTSSTASAGCSGATTLTATSGSFSDGSMANNYNNNQFCTWLLQPPTGTVTLSFSAFATEVNLDRVIVFDGVDNTAPQIGSFSGTAIPASLTSTTNSMYIEFRTNGTVTDAGWDASYINNIPPTACSGLTNLTAATGNLDDGSGTGNYQNNANCTWLIQPAGTPASITFNINSINLADVTDRVRVYDGTNNTGTQIGNYFLNSTGAPAIAYSGSMFVEFTSNGTNNAAGWDASYTSSSTFCSPLTTLTAASGSFTDGSPSTSSYLNNSDCSWLIQPTGLVNRSIQFSFNRFSTEANNDTVTFYDGATTAAPILGTFSGNLAGITNITSSGPEMLMTFKSNGSIVGTGWSGFYTDVATPSCIGNTILTAASGTFDDGSAATANYTDNSNCSWLIQPTGAGRVSLDFNRFNTEGGFDFVTVFDGSSNAAPILGTFDGTNIPPTIISSGGSLFLQFTSDGSVTFTGWEATYTSITSQCFPLITTTQQTGTIADGSNANNYQDNLNCTWLIDVARATSVTATFNNFDVNNAGDTLYFYDGNSNTAPLLAKVTGSTNPSPVSSTTGELFVEFITDGTTNAAGWEFTYNSFIPVSCSGTTTLTATSGNVEDGSLGNNYDNNLNCGWLIQPTGAPSNISFVMNSLDLDNSGGFANRDRVRIYDGTDNTGTFLRQYQGTFLNTTPVVATSGSMFIEFITNNTGRAQGWDGTYGSSNTFCVPLTTFTANAGNFSDGSPFGQNYSNNSDCSWLIQPTQPNVAINLSLFNFDTELNNDTVTVYDGATTTDPILATISGSNPTIPNLLSTGGDMLVTFKTNGTTTANGWRANYQTQTIPACSGTTTLTASTGTFEDGSGATGNYAPNSNCSWLIQPTGASLITLDFNRFNLPNNGDAVTIYDGANNGAPVIGSFAGNTIPARVNSSGNSLFVEFTSNGFFELTGWEATYNSTNSQCFSNLSITSYSGNVEDGSGTNNYQDNLACSWLIEPPLATSVTATFNSFDVSSPGDTLFFYDGNSAASTRLAAYSGTTLPASVTSTGNELFVEFITDGATNDAGWDFDFTTTTNVSCAGTTNLTATSGTFDDGSAATANYDNNLSCEWLIQPTGNPATISLSMNRLNLSGFGDIVQVFDNASGTGFPIGQFFGNNTGSPVTSFTGIMLVRFTTDNNNTSTGWEATYSSSSSFCQPNTTLTGNNGNFTDGSPFGQNYLDNTDCAWLIQPAATGVAINLNFFNFDTEAGSDTVTIYDGTTAADPILATFSGNTTPPVVTSSGNRMFVTFKSNGSNTANGWNAFYGTQPIPACAGTTTLTAANGTFDDGSAQFSNYVDNSNCSWLIAPTGALNIDLTFNRFTLQNNDFVNVYGGNSNTAPLIGSYTGNTIPSTINHNGSELFVEFLADGFGNSTGWEASYTSFNTVTLDVPQDTVFINAGAGSTTSLNLTANVNWSSTDNAAWLIASPVNGSGNSTINLLAIQPNIGPERSAELIFNSATTATADTVVVIQLSSGRYVDVAQDTLYFAANSAPNQSVAISSNVNWTLAPSQAWIMATPSTGSGNGSSSIMVQNNGTSNVRTGYILITGTQNASNDTLWIVQDTIAINNNPTLSLDKMNITLAQLMGSSDVFTVNSTTTWQTSTSAAWLDITNPAVLSDTQTVTVTANSMNLAPLPRAGFVAVQDVSGTLFDTVFVFQAGTAPILIGAPDTVLLGATAGSSGILNIGSTGNWTGIEGDPWFSMSQTSGSGITTINLTTNSANTGNSQLFSFVALEDVANNLTDTIIVIQDTISVGLATNPDTLRVGAAVGSSATFSLSSNLGWTAVSSETWLTVTPDNGTGSSSISVTADLNPNTTERTAFVAVSTIGGALNTDTVWVIQEGFVANLTVNPAIVNLGFLTGSSETIDIASNTSWVVSNPASWLSISSTSGINNQTLTISATSDNLTGATRTATIQIDGIGAVTQSVTVNQIDGSSPVFISSRDTVFVDNIQGSTGSFSVLSNTNNWTVSESTSWLLINPTTGSQTQRVTALVATRNVFGTTRYANITAQASGFPDFTVVIAQKESDPIFQVAPDSIMIGADSASFTEFNVSSNMPNWTITESAPWLTVTPDVGAFTQRVRATATTRNTSGIQRSAIATISAPPLVPQTIKITQDTVRTIGIENADLSVGLKVYPNPSTGLVTVKLNENINSSETVIRLFNMVGEEIPVNLNFIGSNKFDLNLEGQASGIYFISIQLNGETVNRKLILTE